MIPKPYSRAKGGSFIFTDFLKASPNPPVETI